MPDVMHRYCHDVHVRPLRGIASRLTVAVQLSVVAVTALAGAPATASQQNALTGIPELSDVQRVELDAARDGDDYHEPAFIALIEHARTWPATVADSEHVAPPDLDALLADPAAHRGRVFSVTGRIEQQMRVDAPYGPAHEFFVRTDNGTPIIAYIPADDANAGDRPVWRDGQVITLPARFYKVMHLTARDGVERTYAAFVGNHARAVPTVRGGSWSAPAVIAVSVVVLLGIFSALFIYVRSHRKRDAARPILARSTLDEPLEDGAPLPDEPADALAELRRRAESTRP